MPFRLAVAVVASLLLYEHGPTEGVGQGWTRTLLVAAAGILTALVACYFRRIVRRAPAEERRGLAFRLERLHEAAHWAMLIAVMLWLRWPAVIAEAVNSGHWGLRGGWLLDELLLLAPVVGPLVAGRLVNAGAGIGSGAKAGSRPRVGPPFVECAEWRLALGAVLAPAGLLILTRDTLAVLGVADFAVVAAAAGGLLWLASPLLLRIAFALQPMNDAAPRDVRQAVYVWRTDQRALGVFAWRLPPWPGAIVISDRLLELLTPSQTVALLRHEQAHLDRGHIPARILAAAAPFALAALVYGMCGEPLHELSRQLASAGAAPVVQVGVVGLLLAAVSLVVLSQASVLLEHDADLAACRDERGGFDSRRAADLCGALEKIAQAAGQRVAEGGWLHPPVQRRIALLQAAQSA